MNNYDKVIIEKYCNSMSNYMPSYNSILKQEKEPLFIETGRDLILSKYWIINLYRKLFNKQKYNINYKWNFKYKLMENND